MRSFASFACIDWSGAAVARPPGIAVAVARGDSAPRLIEPEGGWSRAAILDWLIDHARRGTDMLIGFDLSPTLPFIDAGAYFPGWQDSPASPRQLWQQVDTLSATDPHLAANAFVDHDAIAPYFRRHGGREGTLFGGGIGRLREVERHQRATGQARSASCFNLVGAAQVGKSSLTGMRLFHRLAGRIPFWPFDPLPNRGPAIIEIYTSVAARAAGVPAHRSKIREAEALRAALANLGSSCPAISRVDDHATDALVTAAWMRRAAADAGHWHPETLTHDIAQQEGWTFGII